MSSFSISCILQYSFLRSAKFTRATLSVHCPYCESTAVIKAGKQPNGAQRYRCQSTACQRTIFQLDCRAQGRLPQVKRPIIERALNGSGVRDTARVLGDSVLRFPLMPEPKPRRRWAVALAPEVWDRLLSLATAQGLSPRSYVTRLIEREHQRSAKPARKSLEK